MATDAFTALAAEPRWLAWREEMRNGRPSKIPYSARGGYGKADNPATWAPRSAAEAAAKRLPNGSGTGGVGVVLGDLGTDQYLIGVDLDACLDDGIVVDWAAEILGTFDSYCETSPGGAGLKLFCYAATEDVRPFLDRIGADAGTWGVQRAPVVGGIALDSTNHGPKIEIYCSHRYFAVTGRHWSQSPGRIVLLDRAALDALAALVPAKAGGHNADDFLKNGHDNSRSGKAFRRGAELRREGCTFAEFCKALANDPDPGIREWVSEKGEPEGRRGLKRIWRKCVPEAGDAPSFSDEALALRLAAEHDGRLRYTAAWSRWFLWDGVRWAADETLTAFSLARELCRNAGTDPKAGKIARTIASAKTVAAVASLARADRRIATHHNAWDGDIWRLAGPVTIDLRTGAARQPHPDDLCTKIVAATPEPGDCPLWRGFLHRVTDGDLDLQDYLQRVAGYCLTGSTREHVMFFLYGVGANGKSVFTGTLRAIWGDYATVAPIETFIETHTDHHPTELAHLRGARLVIAQETERGRRWAESKIKALTGGDPITARYMRQDFFEFTPQFKLLIAGNHKPGLRGVDEAIRRRMHLVPFTVTIPPADRDKELPEKIKAERSAILRWAVDGCREWQRIGLAPPAAVIAATDEYLRGEDALGQWIEERCAIDRIYSASAAGLYADWKSWSEAGGERPESQRRFSQALEARGFEKRHTEHGRKFIGIALKP